MDYINVFVHVANVDADSCCMPAGKGRNLSKKYCNVEISNDPRELK